jgi:conjugal transfer pilus assembly protein TraD
MMRGERGSLLLLAALAALVAAPSPLLAALAALAGTLVAARVARAVRARLARGRGSAPGAIGLGVDGRGRAVTIAPAELAAHGLILGASGTGKTTTLLRILTAQIVAGRPVVAIDMKGSPAFARVLAQASAAAGRRFKLWTMDGGASWNPLQHGNPTELKDKLIATERFTEPHYQRAAERHLQLVLRTLQAAHPDRPTTLQEVVETIDPARLPRLLRELPPPLAESVRDYLAGLTADQHSAIRGVQTRLALITESQAGPFLSPGGDGEQIDLEHALTGGEVVVFSLNSSTYGKLAAQLGTLAVQDLVAALGRRLATAGATRTPATIAVDEFSGLGGDHVVNLFARVREAGGGVLVATQEMADLDRAASGLRDQVIGNTAFKLIHRQEVPASARMVAEMAGTERAWEETRRVGGALFGTGAGSRGTRRQVDRFVIEPGRIMTLRTGEAAMISRLRGGPGRLIRVSPTDRRPPNRTLRPDAGRSR